MFGYIKPLKSELKIAENEIYHAFYCGMCNELKTKRLFLAYDFAFLTLLYTSLNDIPCEFKKHPCKELFLKKTLYLEQNEATKIVKNIALKLLNEKKIDNIADEPFKALFWRLFDFGTESFNLLSKQLEVEKNNPNDIDSLCNPTADTLAVILESFSQDNKNKRILNRLGYMLGRFIYLCDAVDDYKKDKEKNRFNYFVKNNSINDAQGMLNLTITEIAATYSLLDLKSYKGILDNIIYLGLQDTADNLLKGGKRQN